MGQTLTDLVELAVGIGCLAGAAAAWRVRRLRWLAVVLAIAGMLAAIHAIVALAS
ncbi:MAG TPA: hypothetical protein VIC58_01805 [Actinomycetota bacterium]|jgi:hypothetical protein